MTRKPTSTILPNGYEEQPKKENWFSRASTKAMCAYREAMWNMRQGAANANKERKENPKKFYSNLFNGVAVPLFVGWGLRELAKYFAVQSTMLGLAASLSIPVFPIAIITTALISIGVSIVVNKMRGKKSYASFFRKDKEGKTKFDFGYLALLAGGSIIGASILTSSFENTNLGSTDPVAPAPALPELPERPPVEGLPPIEGEGTLPIEGEDDLTDSETPVDTGDDNAYGVGDPEQDNMPMFEVTPPTDTARAIIEAYGLTDNARLMETLSYAEKGHSWALNDLGAFFSAGCDGLPKEHALAYQFFEQAAEKNNAMGLFNQAYALMWNVGVEADQARAIEIMKGLAEGERHDYAQSYYEQWSTKVFTGDDLTGSPCADAGCDTDTACPTPVGNPFDPAPVIEEEICEGFICEEVPVTEEEICEEEICEEEICEEIPVDELDNLTFNYDATTFAGVCAEIGFYEDGEVAVACDLQDGAKVGDHGFLGVLFEKATGEQFAMTNNGASETAQSIVARFANNNFDTRGMAALKYGS